VNIIQNETRGKEHARRGYIYTVPKVHLMMSDVLYLERHIVLDKDIFLDVFAGPG
jgi:hypothetical protein